jgi:hypothetical protein
LISFVSEDIVLALFHHGHAFAIHLLDPKFRKYLAQSDSLKEEPTGG